MSVHSATARTLGCSACGGRLSIERLAPEVFCPFCGNRQALPAAWLREHQEQRAQFSEAERRTEAAGRDAATWRKLARQTSAFGSGTVMLVQAVFVGIGLLAFKVLPERLGFPVLVGSLVCVGPTVLGLLLLGRRRARVSAPRKAARRRRSDVRVHELSCPSCGAPNPYNPRQEQAACGFCESPLFPGKTLVAASLDAAQRAKRQAQLELCRAERAGTAALALAMRSDFMSRYGRHATAFALSLGAGAILVALTRDVQSGKEPELAPALVLWGLVPVPLIYSAWRAYRERALSARLVTTLELVARQGGGRVDDDMGEYLAWLDRHWAGRYDVPYADLGAWFHSIRLEVGGYPALLELNLDPRVGTGGRVRALLAAWVPALSEEDPAAATASRPQQHLRLLQLGWSVQATGAGLVARFDVDIAAPLALLREPESATALTGVLAHLAELARSLAAVA